jgi:hypothetical protein
MDGKVKKEQHYFERKLAALQNGDPNLGIEPLDLWWKYIIWSQKNGSPKVDAMIRQTLNGL